MDNQHRKIAGYRELGQEEIDLMNEIKATGKTLGDLVDKLKALAEFAGAQADPRWISIGQTHLQQGLMALTRAVAKPTFF